MREGRIDVVINNAGGPPPGVTMPRFGFLGLDDGDWHAMLDFNLLSAVRPAAPRCRDARGGGGAIVNVSSNGVVPSAVNVDYGAAKAALINLTKALSEEFGPQGVRVNGVCPGPVLTPWWTDAGGAADVLAEQTGADREAVLGTLAPEMMALTRAARRPAGDRRRGRAVASPRSASTTGTELVVDSGLVKAT